MKTALPVLLHIVIILCLLPLTADAQDSPLLFHPNDTTEGYTGYTALRLFPLPPGKGGPGAADDARGVFGLHAYSVPFRGPTEDRANEAVTFGWNPMGRLQPDQPGFWWQYEWGYGLMRVPMFELNLDVRDSASVDGEGYKRRISYKMERKTGRGISADFSFDNTTFVSGSRSAGDKLLNRYVQIAPGSDRFRVNLRADFRKLVQHAVISHSTADARLFLPLERGTMFSARLIPLYGAVSDSTQIQLNDMQAGVQFVIKIRNEREYAVRLYWKPLTGRQLYWDTGRPAPDSIGAGETLVVRIITDEGTHAFGSVHGRFLENE